MKRLLLVAALCAVSTGASANTIERACLSSDRDKANRILCGCIQDVADLVLSQADQRRAATLITDPGASQDVRRSDARRDERFWQSYRSFGKYAETYCG